MIHVMLERQIAPGLESTYDRLARETLRDAFQASGFINGEAFSDINHPNRRIIISKWRSIQDWQRWHQSDARRDLMNKLSPVMMEPESVRIMEHLAAQ